MFVTLSGIMIDPNREHPRNELPPMFFTPFSIVTSQRLMQLINAPAPMSVTPAGIVIERKRRQL